MSRISAPQLKRRPFWLWIGLGVLGISVVINILLLADYWQKNLVVSVTDGDTFTLSDGRHIRLLGVDAPELDRCLGGIAKERLTQLVLGKRVRLKDTLHDSYGRILANVIADQPFNLWMEYLYNRYITKAPYKNLAMVNRVMVEEGFVQYAGSGTQYHGLLSDARETARTRKRGTYSSVCLQTTPPIAKCSIKGNIRADKQTYFLPDCGNYEDVDVSTSFGDQWFCSASEAERAGFTRSPTCTKN